MAALAAGIVTAADSGSYSKSGFTAPGLWSGAEELERMVLQPGIPKNLIRDGHRRNGADAREVVPALAQGWTLQVENAELYSPEMAALCGRLEDALGGDPVRVNVYFSTTPGRLGFPAHHDTLDAAAVQVSGAKRWEVWGRSIDHPIWWMRDHRQPVDDRRPDLEVDLEEGDVLFLRLGDPHRAACLLPPSLHLTIGVRRPNAHDFLSWLVDQATDRADIRTPMPWASAGQDTGTARLGWLQGVLGQLGTLGAGRSASEWLDAYLDDRAAVGPVPAAAPWGRGGPVGPDSSVRFAHPRLRSRLSGSAVVFDGRRVSLPADLVPAVRILVADRGRQWTVRGLSAAADVDLRRLGLLIEVLLDEGLLRKGS